MPVLSKAVFRTPFYANDPDSLYLLLHALQRHRILLGLTHPAVDSTGNDNGFIITIRRAIGVDDVGHFFGMRFAHSSATKAAGSMSGSFTVPTFHNYPVTPDRSGRPASSLVIQ
jgi:hypothetical protein